MSETVQAALDKANPNTISDNLRLARIGRTLADGTYFERVAVVGNVAALAIPAKSILACFMSAAGAPGWAVPVINEAVPAAGQCCIDPDGNALFAGADAVTECEIIYQPVIGDLLTETVAVAAGGLSAALPNGHHIAQLVTATLDAAATLPGVKTVVARGTAAPASPTMATSFAGATVQFAPADCVGACMATITYYATPGEGTGVRAELHTDLATLVPTP